MRHAFVTGVGFGSMPNIRKYKQDPGYYIYARPSDAGNITYRIDEVAYPIFDELGYEHEDPISWRIIQVLKLLGLDDTDGEGTTPDPDTMTFEAEKSPDMTHREQFYELLQEVKTLSPEDEKRVRETLGLAEETDEEGRSEFENQAEASNELADHWRSGVEKTLDKQLREAFPQMSTEHLLNGDEDDSKAISVTEMDDEYQADYVITIEEPRVKNGQIVEYQVTVTEDSVIVDMVDRFVLSQEGRAEAFSHSAIIDKLFRRHDPSFEAATPNVELRF